MRLPVLLVVVACAMGATCAGVSTPRGLRLYGCQAQADEVDAVVERMAAHFPGTVRALERVEVMCSDLVPERIAGEAMWLGSALVRPRVRLQTEHGACEGALAHELAHLALWALHNEPCPTHTPDCGWTREVELAIEDARTVCR